MPPVLRHAIGHGVMVSAVEPEDLSVFLRWCDFDTDGRKHVHLACELRPLWFSETRLR